MGCPLNKPIRRCGRCTALHLAVDQKWKGSKEIVLWLLHNDGGAWTEVCAKHNATSGDEAIGIIQFIIQDEDYNDVLEVFLDQYQQFWPEWLVDSQQSAAHMALDNDNLEGLRILLDWVKKKNVVQSQPFSR